MVKGKRKYPKKTLKKGKRRGASAEKRAASGIKDRMIGLILI